MTQPETTGRGARLLAATAIFLCFAGVVVTVVAYRYLLPAIAAAKGADPVARKQLAAISSLVLVVVLVCLLLMLVILFRPARMFLPGKSEPRSRTRYVDVWAEAGKRMETPPKEEPDSPDDENPA